MNKKRRSRNALSNWTDFTGKYEAMKCGSWLAADDGIRTFNKDYDNEVIVCYHPILPIGRLKTDQTGIQTESSLDRDYSTERYHIFCQQNCESVKAWCFCNFGECEAVS